MGVERTIERRIISQVWFELVHHPNVFIFYFDNTTRSISVLTAKETSSFAGRSFRIFSNSRISERIDSKTIRTTCWISLMYYVRYIFCEWRIQNIALIILKFFIRKSLTRLSSQFEDTWIILISKTYEVTKTLVRENSLRNVYHVTRRYFEKDGAGEKERERKRERTLVCLGINDF